MEQEVNTWLVSYPRSGNTWFRYCLEVVSKQPTRGYAHPNKNSIDNPLANFVNTGAQVDKPFVATKRHEFPPRHDDDKVIFILRNYKECIVRHYKTMVKANQNKEGIWEEQLDWYWRMINTFDNITHPKLLIRYEDTIKDPIGVMHEACEFLGISKEHIPELRLNLPQHRVNALKVYGKNFPSLSKGKDPKFHSKTFDKTILDFMDKNLKDRNPELFNKYLSCYE